MIDNALHWIGHSGVHRGLVAIGCIVLLLGWGALRIYRIHRWRSRYRRLARRFRGVRVQPDDDRPGGADA